jgi:hypothetical protein
MNLCPQCSTPRISLGQIPKRVCRHQADDGVTYWLNQRGVKDFCVRQMAINILFENGVLPKDCLGEIRALFARVPNNVRYTRDIHHVELLHSARRLLELREHRQHTRPPGGGRPVPGPR